MSQPPYGAGPGWQQPPPIQPPPPQGWPQGPPPQQGWQPGWQRPAPPPQWGPQGQAAPQWGPQGQLPGPTFGTHFKRAIDWNLAEVVVSPRERAALTAAGVEERLQALFAWRRSSLIVALPLVLLSVVLGFINSAQRDSNLDLLNGLGHLAIFMPPIALLLVPLGIWRAISGWTELRTTSRLLLNCYAISIALPLATALLPVSWIVDHSKISGQLAANGTGGNVDQAIEGVGVVFAILYALQLLPIIVSVPGGVLKGAARVKSMFPTTTLTGWFLVTVAPFYSLSIVVVFVLIEQIVGNVLLLIGIGLLAFLPWLFVINRKTYARPLSLAEAKTELARASRLGGVFLLGGVFFILIYLATAKVGGKHVIGTSSDSATFTFLDVGKTLTEMLGRSIVSTVVFSTVFLQMVFAEFFAQRSLRDDIKKEHDREMRALERYVTRNDTIDTSMTRSVPNFKAMQATQNPGPPPPR